MTGSVTSATHYQDCWNSTYDHQSARNVVVPVFIGTGTGDEWSGVLNPALVTVMGMWHCVTHHHLTELVVSVACIEKMGPGECPVMQIGTTHRNTEMAKVLYIVIKYRWWVKYYLLGVSLMCFLSGKGYDHEKFDRVLTAGIVTRFTTKLPDMKINM